MQEELLDLIAQAIVVFGYAAAGAVFAGVGALFEYRSYLFVNSGEPFLAVWLGALGVLLLGLAYLTVSDKTANAYRELQGQR